MIQTTDKKVTYAVKVAIKRKRLMNNINSNINKINLKIYHQWKIYINEYNYLNTDYLYRKINITSVSLKK